MPDRLSRHARICPACDGFASVAITLGGRTRHGHRRLTTAHCTTCQGTGQLRATRTREVSGV